MKRSTHHHRLRHWRRARDVCRLRAKWARRRNAAHRRDPDEHVLCAPGIFSLDDSNSSRALARFLGKLRHAIVRHRRPVLIDMIATHQLRPSALLVFVAEVDRLVRATAREVRVRCRPPNNQRTLAVLDQVGFLRHMKCKQRRRSVAPDVVFWRYATGSDVNGARVEDILAEHEASLPPGSMTGLFKGLSEAMTNCHHHAYSKPRADGLNLGERERRWWMFSQKRDNALEVVFCDLGVGIPETLPLTRPSWAARLANTVFRAGCTDADAIVEATKPSTTSTAAPHRGKGLPEIVSLVRTIPRAQVRIVSNRGEIRLSDTGTQKATFNDSIMGTLIGWRVPLTTSTEEDKSWL